MTVLPLPDRHSPRIRPATRNDGETILSLIKALAEYEKLPPPDADAGRRLVSDMFGERPKIQCFLAEIDGVAAGYALILETYSSFLARPTLFLEDIFVLPEYRSRKVGYSLFVAMVDEAHRRGCGRMEWTVLDWNTHAIDFYKRLGAVHMKEWQLFRLTRNELEGLLPAHR